MIVALLFAVITSTAAPPGCPAGPLGLVGCCRTAPRLVSRVDAPYRSVANARHLHGHAGKPVTVAFNVTARAD